MPRAPADSVVIHRIELGGYERDLLDQVLAAVTIRQGSEAVESLLMPLTTCTVSGAVVVGLLLDTLLGGGPARIDRAWQAAQGVPGAAAASIGDLRQDLRRWWADLGGMEGWLRRAPAPSMGPVV